MKVFLSWSGERSRLMAHLLRDWLPIVLQEVEPWLAGEDLAAGTNFLHDLERGILETDAAIVCLSSANVHNPWLNFELGAIGSRRIPVYVLLIDIGPADFNGPPMQLQTVDISKQGIGNLLWSLNKLSATPLADASVDRAFESTFPDFLARTQEILASGPDATPRPTSDDKLDEVLDTVRDLSRAMNSISDTLLTSKTTPPPLSNQASAGVRMKPRLFIGSSVEGRTVADAVQTALEHLVEAVVWDQDVFPPSFGTMETLVDATREFDYAAIVMTADDILIKRAVQTMAPRDNLLFEVGLFTGALGRARTFVIHPRDKNLEFPSDFKGVTLLSFDGKRSDNNIFAAVGPACARMKSAMGLMKVKRLRHRERLGRCSDSVHPMAFAASSARALLGCRRRGSSARLRKTGRRSGGGSLTFSELLFR